MKKSLWEELCPNRGCVPSKLLIGYADVAHGIRHAKRHHITAEITEVDREQMFADVNAWIEAVDPRYESRFPDGLSLYRGEAYFVEDKVVAVGEEKLTAKNIVIATGTRSRPPMFSDFPVWTSENLFPFKHEVPKSIAIVGGGFIACEIGNFFHSIGVETTMLVRGGALLTQEDKTISKVFSEQYAKEVPTLFHTTIEQATYENAFKLILNKEGETAELQVDAVLYATGRIPNSESLQLSNTQIELDKRGFVVRDDNLETKVSGVYAAGDIGGKFQLQHASSYEVAYLVDRLVHGKNGEIEFPAMPHAVFSEPEVASVGITEQQVEEEGLCDDLVIIEVDWKTSARMLSWRVDYPLTKLIVSKKDFSIIGTTEKCLSPHSSL